MQYESNYHTLNSCAHYKYDLETAFTHRINILNIFYYVISLKHMEFTKKIKFQKKKLEIKYSCSDCKWFAHTKSHIIEQIW